MMPEEHMKESLSIAYFSAIAGKAGVPFHINGGPDYGVDVNVLGIHKVNNRICTSGLDLDIQLKASVKWAAKDGHIVYSLNAKNYNDMVTRRGFSKPLLLVLLCLPREEDHWVCAEDECLVMRKNCYWYWEHGEPTANTASKVIKIPEYNLLTPDVLKEFAACWAREERPWEL